MILHEFGLVLFPWLSPLYSPGVLALVECSSLETWSTVFVLESLSLAPKEAEGGGGIETASSVKLYLKSEPC